EYFNRGTDIVASLRIEDIFAGADSPINGFAVGRVRPLRDLGLPFMKNLDDILVAVQTGGASVRIRGTLATRRLTPPPLRDIGNALRGLFGNCSPPPPRRPVAPPAPPTSAPPAASTHPAAPASRTAPPSTSG